MSQSFHPLDHKILLGRYRVIRLLGEGGMGTVHLARVEGAEGFTRPVVVKRMKRDLRTTEEGNRLFIREAKILSKLQHPGIVGISDFGIDDGVPTMVLEYVHGYTLSPWLSYRVAKTKPFPVDICLYIVRRILDALHYAHRFNTEEGNELEIVHRDISPDNVLISNRGYIHLLDFGIASIRGQGAAQQTGGFRGKLCYSAPETVIGEQATPRSDQYSAAVVLLEMLTGVTPFEANSVAETFMRMVSDAPELPSKSRDDIPPGLDDVLAAALAKDPLKRFDSAQSFARELRRFQTQDDDEVAERLRELVQQDFDAMPAVVHVEPLRDRQAALERLLSEAPAPLPVLEIPETELAPKAAKSSDSAGSAATLLGLGTAMPPVVSPAPNRQLQGLLWGLLVVGGLIAVGLGATVAVLSRTAGTNSDQQVVVVGGGRDEEPPGKAANPGGETPPSPTSVDAAPPAAPGPDTPAAPVAAAPMTAKSVAAPSPATNQAQLAQAVHQKSGSFQACFVQHLEPGQNAPEAVLHFEVAKAGGAAQVKAEPKAVAGTALGQCLVQAGSSVRFPPLEQPVSFRVPVRARVSRSAGK